MRRLVWLVAFLIATGAVAQETPNKQIAVVRALACEKVEQVERLFEFARLGAEPQMAAMLVNTEVGKADACGIVQGMFLVSAIKQLNLEDLTFDVMQLEPIDGSPTHFSWRVVEKPKGQDA